MSPFPRWQRSFTCPAFDGGPVLWTSLHALGGESRDTFANQKSPDSLALQGVPSDHAVAAGLLSLTMHDAGGRSAPQFGYPIQVIRRPVHQCVSRCEDCFELERFLNP